MWLINQFISFLKPGTIIRKLNYLNITCDIPKENKNQTIYKLKDAWKMKIYLFSKETPISFQNILGWSLIKTINIKVFFAFLL